jgi:uncharacterized protein YjbI with pentapeptide repeats
MKKLGLLIIVVAVSFIWYGFQSDAVIATTGSESIADKPPTNFTGANLTGANLEGVSLDGVILCNTIIPDGTTNNSSCKN